MIRIDFPEPNDARWITWRKQCAVEQARLNAAMAAWRQKWANTPAPHDHKLKAREKPKVKDAVYKAWAKEVYIVMAAPFYGKCGYCETKIYAGMHGDIEHFRPKGAVTDQAGKPVVIDVAGVEEEHPGYYWLAYDWVNLLPACQLCNEPSMSHSPGRRIGKWNYFPVIGAVRAAAPGEEVNELPMLINPVVEDPAQHLQLDEVGVLYATTERGQACIDVFGLNERDLPNDRAKVYKDTKRLIIDLLAEAEKDPNSQRTKDLLEQVGRVQEGREPHTMAARLAIEKTLTPLLPIILGLLNR
jgi:hypothetical protein